MTQLEFIADWANHAFYEKCSSEHPPAYRMLRVRWENEAPQLDTFALLTSVFTDPDRDMENFVKLWLEQKGVDVAKIKRFT